MTGKINSYIIEIIEEAKSKTIQTGKNKMGNQLKKRMSQIFVILWIIVLLPSLVLSQTRLATSTLMMKSQASNGFSINPLTKGESRASFDYSTVSGSVSYISPSYNNYNDGKWKASSMKFGYDGKTKFGHFSGWYSSYKRKYDYTRNYTWDNGCTADYDTSVNRKITTITGVVSGQSKEKIKIAGVFRMVSVNGDINKLGTQTNNCTWVSTGTSTETVSGTASASYNQIGIFGKRKVSDKMSFGFFITPEAGNTSKYSNDYSTTNFRVGNGLIIGGAIGSESTDTVYEVGLSIEQESKDSGDASQRDLFFLYETVLEPGVVVLAGYTNSESEKFKDGSTNIARPYSSSIIDLAVQFEMDELYSSVQLDLLNTTYGNYGDTASDKVKPASEKATIISFTVDAFF